MPHVRCPTTPAELSQNARQHSVVRCAHVHVVDVPALKEVDRPGDDADPAVRSGRRVDRAQVKVLEATSRALEALSSLAPLAANAPAARQQLIGTIEFTSNVHRIGLSTVLELVSKYGVNVGGTSFDGIVAFAQAIKDLAKVPHISVATLNYDGLTHAGFLRIEQPICDLASGRTADRDFLPSCTAATRSSATAFEIMTTSLMIRWR